MEIFCKNTARGLVPVDDSDYENKSKLSIGKIYKVTIKLPRNYELHKKYFALINCAWDFQPERSVEHFKNDIETFRKTIEIAAGHCDVVYSIKRREWIEQAKSISFDKMDEFEFRNLYENVKNVIYKLFLSHVSQDEFEKRLMDF